MRPVSTSAGSPYRFAHPKYSLYKYLPQKYLPHLNARRTFAWLASGLVVLSCALPLTSATAQINAPRYGNYATNVTLRGTIANTSTFNTDDTGVFTFRTDNGEVLRVILHEDIRFLGDSRFFARDNRVEIEGIRDGDVVIARDVRVFDNNRYLSILRGVVQSDVRNGRFTLTLNEGSDNTPYGRNRANRTVQVNVRGANLNNIRRGDEVELRGTWQGTGRFLSNSIFNAESISSIRGSDSYYPGDEDYQSGRQTTLRGWVVDDILNTSNNRFRISLRNNQTVDVRSDDNVRLNRNDYAEVRGRWDLNDRVFRADSVRTLDARSGDRNTNRVDFTGTVQSFNSNNRITVRGDNGRNYEVYAPINLDRNISRGDRVRVVGTVDNDGTTRADSITLETRYTDLDFTGTIAELPSGLRNYYTVRTGEGREFRVNYNASTSLRVGDRVRVHGRVNGNFVDADSIVRI